MTLARTALRLAAVNALKGEIGSSTPTIAENRIYDSRIGDISPEVYAADAMPTVIVLTDEDEGDALSHQNGGPPFKRLVSLVFEFAMVQGMDVPVADGGTAFVPGYPATDAEHEASLDLLEFQIAQRLAYNPDPECVLFRSFTRIRKHDCHRQVLDEYGVKVAARVLTWQVEVSDDQVMVRRTTDPQPTGLDVLPEPLRSVAKALPDGVELDTCKAIAAALTPLTAEPFEGLDVTAPNAVRADGSDASDQVGANINVPQS